MKFTTTCIYEQNAAAWLSGTKRRAFNEGGTSSSKTYSIMQLLILIAGYAKSRLLISVVSESMPHLKRGAIRDFMELMGDQFHENCWNKTDKIYLFGNGTIEFFSADEPAKLRGGRRDILFLNEANNIAYDSYRELDVRTRRFIFADWNPVSEFWYHENNLGSQPENAYIHSTYMDVKSVLPPEIVANIERNRLTDPNWYNVYGLGLLGKIEGLVYPVFNQVPEFPPGGYEFFGLDFGYSNDPTVLVRCKIRGDELYSQQLIYQTGMTNDEIARRMAEVGVKKNYDEIWADSAEPKSIEEIHRYGFNVKPVQKGADSVEFGHQKVREFRQYWTQDSLDCIKEQRNFTYIRDKDNKLTDKTTHRWSHGMDARRYGVIGAFAPVEREEVVVFDTMSLVEAV
jgi:phage terminase large subunit